MDHIKCARQTPQLKLLYTDSVPVNSSLTFKMSANIAPVKRPPGHGGAWVIKDHLFLQIGSKLAEKFEIFTLETAEFGPSC